MKIAYLTAGPSTHGVVRYGRLLAEEACLQGDALIRAITVLDHSACWNGQDLTDAAGAINDCDLLHLQYNATIWGSGWQKLKNLKQLLNRVRRPVVVTLHDIYPYESMVARIQLRLIRKFSPGNQGSSNIWLPNANRRSSDMGLLEKSNQLFNRHFADEWTLRWLADRADGVLVCFEEEARRLRPRLKRETIDIIPIFVERRIGLPPPEVARHNLGLSGRFVVTLLGHIHPRKGYDLVVAALPQLPDDVAVIFAGGVAPGNEDYLAALQTHVAGIGCNHRLRITGYLDESTLQEYLAATHLAVCPFQSFSASGSLATWISVARPILASAQPQIDEYQKWMPHSIQTFTPRTPQALASAIINLMPVCRGEAPAVAQLREALSLEKIFGLHLAVYQSVLERSK